VRRRQFERLVVRSLDNLPPAFLGLLDNVEIVIDDEPTADQRARGEWQHSAGEAAEDAEEVFGLYEGTPLTMRWTQDGMRLPDKITLFRGPLERAFPNRAELAEQVRVTVIHELAHYFGLDEDQIAELGYS
jgi:predicted Zn-dependent protease with MMP-like domain